MDEEGAKAGRAGVEGGRGRGRKEIGNRESEWAENFLAVAGEGQVGPGSFLYTWMKPVQPKLGNRSPQEKEVGRSDTQGALTHLDWTFATHIAAQQLLTYLSSMFPPTCPSFPHRKLLGSHWGWN